VILAGTVYVVRVLPDVAVRFALRVFATVLFRIRITGHSGGLRDTATDPLSDVASDLRTARDANTLPRASGDSRGQNIRPEKRFRRSATPERNWRQANWWGSFPKAA
jgi:hypothetical protein